MKNIFAIQPPPQPNQYPQYCPSCCTTFGIIFNRKIQCKCCQRYFCSSCLEGSKTKYCHICTKHSSTVSGCVSVLATYLNDGNTPTKKRAFSEFLQYWSNSVLTVDDLIKGGMIPSLLHILKYKEYQMTIIDILIFALKKIFITENHRRIIMILGSIVVSCMKGSSEGKYQTIGDVLQTFEKARDLVVKENYQFKEYRREFIEIKESKDGEMVDRILAEFASKEILLLLHVLYKEAVEERKVIEVIYRFFACSIESTKLKLDDKDCKAVVEMIDSQNAQSLIILIIAYSKTHKSIHQFITCGLINKIDQIVQAENKENNVIVCELLEVFRSFPAVFTRLSATPEFLEIIINLVLQEDNSTMTASNVLQEIITSIDVVKQQLAEQIIEIHPEVVEKLLNSNLSMKQMICLRLCKVLLSFFGDIASFILLSRGILDSIISLSRTDEKLTKKCYKILRIAAQYHIEVTEHYIQSSFICTLFVNMPNNPLDSLIALNEFVQYEAVKQEIMNSPSNIEEVCKFLQQSNSNILHEALHLLNSLLTNETVIKSVTIPLFPLLLPLFKKLQRQSFAVFLLLLQRLLPYVQISDDDASNFVNSMIIFLSQKTTFSHLQMTYSIFSVAIKKPKIRKILASGDSNDIEADGYFSFLVCSFISEKSLLLKASQIKFFTSFIDKDSDDSEIALDILNPLFTYILQAPNIVQTNQTFILETLKFMIAALTLEINEVTTQIYQSKILQFLFDLALKWNLEDTNLMEQFIKLSVVVNNQIHSFISEFNTISDVLSLFLSNPNLPLDSAISCINLLQEIKDIGIPIQLQPTSLHTLLIVAKYHQLTFIMDLLQTIPNLHDYLHTEVDLLLHSSIPSIQELGFSTSKQHSSELMINGLFTLIWEDIQSTQITQIIQILDSTPIQQYILHHKLLIPFLRFISESNLLIENDVIPTLLHFLSKLPYTPYHIQPLNSDSLSSFLHLLEDVSIRSIVSQQPQYILQLVDQLPFSLPLLYHFNEPSLQPLLLLTIDFHQLIQTNGNALHLLTPTTFILLIILKMLYHFYNKNNAIITNNELPWKESNIIQSLIKELHQLICSGEIHVIYLLQKIVQHSKEHRKYVNVNDLLTYGLQQKNEELIQIVINFIHLNIHFNVMDILETITSVLNEFPLLFDILAIYFTQIRLLLDDSQICQTLHRHMSQSNNKYVLNILRYLEKAVRLQYYQTFIKTELESKIFTSNFTTHPYFKRIESFI
ncbi:FYVE-type domain-containing protein [Entamoeba marina]